MDPKGRVPRSDVRNATHAARPARASAAPHHDDAHAHDVAATLQRLYPGCPDGVIAAALLHHAVARGALTFDDLATRGVSERTIDAITALVRRPQESVELHCQRLRAHTWALMVAHADVVTSSSPAALGRLDPERRKERLGELAVLRRELGMDEPDDYRA